MSQTGSDKDDTEREGGTIAGLALGLFVGGVDIATRKHENSQNTWVLKRAGKSSSSLKQCFAQLPHRFVRTLSVICALLLVALTGDYTHSQLAYDSKITIALDRRQRCCANMELLRMVHGSIMGHPTQVGDCGDLSHPIDIHKTCYVCLGTRSVSLTRMRTLTRHRLQTEDTLGNKLSSSRDWSNCHRLPSI